MRVNEEVDAMEVMGVPSIAFVVSTRLAAVFIVLPIAYLSRSARRRARPGSARSCAPAASRRAPGSSPSTRSPSLTDIVYSFIKGMVMTIAVVLVALYFGYRVRGGPVEVGTATARSMAVNLILVTVLNMVMTFLFWGFDPRLPIA